MQLGMKFVSGDDILSIRERKYQLKEYARPGQSGTYQITRNMQKDIRKTFYFISKLSHRSIDYVLRLTLIDQ